MKKLVYFAALALLFACTPENKDGEKGKQINHKEELTITGDVLEITGYSATIEGYANLPFELCDAEVGIMYDTQKSFAEVRKVAARELDGNNKFAVTITGLESSTTYYYKSYVQKGMAVKHGVVKSFTTEEFKLPAVDLGLSVKWAACNLGASNPEDFGDYYARGETETKSEYIWATYKWGTGTATLTKYNCDSPRGTVDNKTVLDLEDDVVRLMIGGSWRIPTDAEWTELRTMCTWSWTTQNGVDGYMITGLRGNSIFLPAAGYRYATSVGDAGSSGYYWSSSLSAFDPKYAVDVYFESGEVSRKSCYRHFGASVRPVCE